MTCRHGPGDINCTSHHLNPNNPSRLAEQDRERKKYEKSLTPDASKFQIIDAEQVGPHLVLKILYPNCSKCSYEGNKVLVYRDQTALSALRWREIDPHFADPAKAVRPNQAPSPMARFPASPVGWQDALEYARSKASK